MSTATAKKIASTHKENIKSRKISYRYVAQFDKKTSNNADCIECHLKRVWKRYKTRFPGSHPTVKKATGIKVQKNTAKTTKSDEKHRQNLRKASV